MIHNYNKIEAESLKNKESIVELNDKKMNVLLNLTINKLA